MIRRFEKECFYICGKYVKYSKTLSSPCITCAFYNNCSTVLYNFSSRRKRIFNNCGTFHNYKEI